MSWKPDPRAWDWAEDRYLTANHGTGLGWSKMALHLNRTVGSVESRARKLGLVKRKAPHRENPGSYMPAGVPLELGEGDQLYIDACMKAGGFASSVRHAGKIVFGHAGKAWVQP